MILLKDENVKILNEFDQSNRSAVMNLLMYRYSIPEFDADDIMQDAWVLLLEKLAVGEMLDVPKKLSAYLAKVCIHKAHEYLRKRQNGVRNISFDDVSFSPEELTAYETEAQSWEEFLEESRRAEHRRLDMMEKELDKLSDREKTLLLGYYDTDGCSLRSRPSEAKASMKELARKLGYSCDRVAITLKSRIMKKLRNGILQQERALGDGLSPVALFYPSLLYVDVERIGSRKQEMEDWREQEGLGVRRRETGYIARTLLADLISQIMGKRVADPSVGDHIQLNPVGALGLLLNQRDERIVHHQHPAAAGIAPIGMLRMVIQRVVEVLLLVVLHSLTRLVRVRMRLAEQFGLVFHPFLAFNVPESILLEEGQGSQLCDHRGLVLCYHKHVF